MAKRRRVGVWWVAVGGILLAVVAAVSLTVGWRPLIGPAARPLTDRRFTSTPARLARGKYIFTAASVCVGCHSEWDRTLDGHPPRAGVEGAGKTWADEGMPWLTAPNLTADPESGAGLWTDDMLARAIREGIGHDGRALFPLMPYARFAAMSDEDLASVVVYLRTLPAVRNALPKTDVPFPPGPLINALPQPITAPVATPDLSTPERKGAYLVRMAVCAECHTPSDERGNKLAGLEFAGGFPLPDATAGHTVSSANITPDPSGIPYYDEALFIQTIRTGRVIARELDDMMPWASYRHLTDDDLKAMFAYLKTLKPVKHTVDNSLPPTPCRLCRTTHGGGERNTASPT
ncbi:MAG TPA: c-type cytochrome [Vicinamibacterales bacterium]|nr:c-type cytochrome [Vicinamibacterales bacterium]